MFFGGYYKVIAIDNGGKVWTWGRNYQGTCGVPDTSKGYLRPTCISNLEGSNIKNIKIKKATTGYEISLLIDTENRLWAFGSSAYGKIGNGIETSEYYWNPICLNDNNENNPLNGVGIIDVACQYETIAAIDENGRLWTWGLENDYGQLGTGERYSYDGSGDYSKNYAIYPICITDLENNELDTVKLVSTSAPYWNNAGAIDSEGNIWMWGDESLALGFENNSNAVVPPTKIMLSKPAHWGIPNFKKIDAGYSTSAGIDENGKVWTWGSGMSKGSNLGTGYNDDYNFASDKPVMVGGYNNKISKETIVDVSVGYMHTLAIDDKGKLWFWGYNEAGVSGISTGKLNDREYGDPICITNLNYEGNIVYGKKIIKIEAGYRMSAIIDSEGKLYTCGRSDYGALADGTYYNRNGYICINDIYPELQNKKIVDVSISNTYDAFHLIVLDEDGNVWTCGTNHQGQLGYVSVTEKNPNLVCISKMPDNLLNGKKIISVSAGNNHSVALDEDGKVYVWGGNNSGQLGNGTTDTVYKIICLTDYKNSKLYGKRIKEIKAGTYITLVVDSEGKVYTCGYNYSFQLGQGETNSSYTSLEMKCINNSTDFIPESISISSQYFAIAVDIKGNVWAWGNNQYFQNGLQIQSSFPIKWVGESYVYDSEIESFDELPIQMSNVQNILTVNDPIEEACIYPENIKDKRLIGKSTIALDEDGKLWTWGENNSYGILGDGTTSSRNAPKCINDGFGGVDISEIMYVDSYLVIVKDIQGNLWSWGDNSVGKTGMPYTGFYTKYLTPQCISKGTGIDGKNIVNVNVFNELVVALDDSGKVYTWGQGAKLGIEYTGNANAVHSVPICISTNTDMENVKIEKILEAGYMMYALDETGNAYIWGSDNYYYNWMTGSKSKPIKFGKGTRFENILISDIQYYNDCYYLTTKEGDLYVWGRNISGQCGTGTTTSVNTPTCLSSKSRFTVKEVLSTGNINMILDTNGNIWTWGYSNNYGQLGTGTTNKVLTPTNISKDKFTVKEIILTGETNIVLDTNGRLWTWGYNYAGQCGTGTTTNVLTPTSITNEVQFENKIDKVIPYTQAILKDVEGKTWVFSKASTSGSVYSLKCLSDEMMFSELLYSSNNSCIAKDMDGKLWSWNPMSSTSKASCFSDGTDLEGKDIKEIICLSGTYFAKDSDGKVYSWGTNTYGQCGTGDTRTNASPKCINTGELENVRFTEISCNSISNTSIQAKDSNGKVWKWGGNLNSVLGLGVTGIIRSPICATDYYKEIGFNPDESRVLSISSMFVAIDKDGKVWTWGSNTSFSGTGIVEGFNPTPVCLSNNNEELNLKNGNVKFSNGLVYAITEDGTAWVWGGSVLTPTKLNDCKEFSGKVIKEIGYVLKDGSRYLYALTTDRQIYSVSLDEGIVIQHIENTNEILQTYSGAGSRQFSLVKDAEYTK